MEEPEDADRASLVLAPATPGRSGSAFTLYVHDGATGLVPDRRGSSSASSLASTRPGFAAACASRATSRRPWRRSRQPAAPEAPTALADAWDGLMRRLPADWSDLYAEVELDSTDYLERGALLLAPVNPARYGGPSSFRFRSASRKGYGVAPGMARRALERLDGEGLSGRVRVLRVLSDTNPVSTQGPVWRVDGRSV